MYTQGTIFKRLTRFIFFQFWFHINTVACYAIPACQSDKPFTTFPRHFCHCLSYTSHPALWHQNHLHSCRLSKNDKSSAKLSACRSGRPQPDSESTYGGEMQLADQLRRLHA